MATPNDHIDMKKSTKATAFATIPICCHIAIMSTVHPPSETKLLVESQYSRESVVEADSNRESLLLQREVHRDGHDDGHGHPVEQRRREDPLAHGVECGLIEKRNRPQHLRFLHLAVGPDRRLDDHDALYARRLRDGRV